MKWVDKEEGPSCFCGMPTVVVVDPDKGEASLLCMFHTQQAGAIFPLPAERPDAWPNMTDDEVDDVMLKGQEEFDAREEKKNEEDEHSVTSGTLN